MAYTAIDDGSAYFHTQLYTGDGNATQAITNDANAGNFQPDWLWIKRRSDAEHHMLADSNRGAGNRLRSDVNNSEDSNGVTSFNTDGFTTLSSAVWNASSKNYVAWQWKANGGTTASNSDGSLASTVQANTTSGFSIVTYTGTGSGTTVGHGLGAIPHLVIVKNRSASQHWRVFHKDAYTGGGYGQYQSGVKLNENSAADHGANSYWNNDPFTTSTFSIGANAEVNVNSENFVAYCFTEKQGYSKFGQYTGNGDADGTFIYLGFKPAYFLLKSTDITQHWYVFDTARDTYNPSNSTLQPSTNNAQQTSYPMDFLSNGFKIRHNDGAWNGSGNSYIYMAFAESPFVSSEKVPCTAR